LEILESERKKGGQKNHPPKRPNPLKKIEQKQAGQGARPLRGVGQSPTVLIF